MISLAGCGPAISPGGDIVFVDDFENERPKSSILSEDYNKSPTLIEEFTGDAYDELLALVTSDSNIKFYESVGSFFYKNSVKDYTGGSEENSTSVFKNGKYKFFTDGQYHYEEITTSTNYTIIQDKSLEEEMTYNQGSYSYSKEGFNRNDRYSIEAITNAEQYTLNSKLDVVNSNLVTSDAPKSDLDVYKAGLIRDSLYFISQYKNEIAYDSIKQIYIKNTSQLKQVYREERNGQLLMIEEVYLSNISVSDEEEGKYIISKSVMNHKYPVYTTELTNFGNADIFMKVFPTKFVSKINLSMFYFDGSSKIYFDVIPHERTSNVYETYLINSYGPILLEGSARLQYVVITPKDDGSRDIQIEEIDTVVDFSRLDDLDGISSTQYYLEMGVFIIKFVVEFVGIEPIIYVSSVTHVNTKWWINLILKLYLSI